MKSKIFPDYIRYLLQLVISMMLMFTLFRLLLLSLQYNQLTAQSSQFLWKALFDRGILFDISVICYAIAPVFLILAFAGFKNIRSPRFYKAVSLLVFIICCLNLLFACADIPYYNYYNSRLTNVVFILSANDSVWLIIRDVFTNPDYLPYTLVFIAGCAIYWFLLRRLYRRYLLNSADNQPSVVKQISFFLVCGYLIFSGVRGHVNPDALPLKLEHAYVTDHTFINQLGLNPTFSFLDSYRVFELHLLDDELAVKAAQEFLEIKPLFSSPLARMENSDSVSQRPNVIVVLIESLSAAKMGRYGHKGNLTPNLDSLANKAITFNNVYSAGIHTHNGIYSSITAMPAIMNNTPMFSSQTSTQTFSGMATTLKENGYKTIFIVTGKRNFDNMQGFLPQNGYDELVSKENYPESEWVNRWGIPDHILFNHAIEKFDSIAALSQPFLGTILTVSTHNPYTIPKGIDFVATSTNAVDMSYEYTDWSIGKFMDAIRDKPWFRNTVFVFTGDHGQNFDPIYDMPLAYHHTPLIFYGPQHISPAVYDDLGLQIDLFPTLMGIIKIPYVNNTLGVNLLTHKRPFVYFSADDKLACLNDEYYLIIQKRGQEALYRYKEKSLENEIEKHPELVAQMKNYTFSMLQTAQWMINNRQVSTPRSPEIITKLRKDGR